MHPAASAVILPWQAETSNGKGSGRGQHWQANIFKVTQRGPAQLGQTCDRILRSWQQGFGLTAETRPKWLAELLCYTLFAVGQQLVVDGCRLCVSHRS